MTESGESHVLSFFGEQGRILRDSVVSRYSMRAHNFDLKNRSNRKAPFNGGYLLSLWIAKYRPDELRGKGEKVRISNKRLTLGVASSLPKKLFFRVSLRHEVRAHQSRSDSTAWQTPTRCKGNKHPHDFSSNRRAREMTISCTFLCSEQNSAYRIVVCFQ